jgi:hypothetical protein
LNCCATLCQSLPFRMGLKEHVSEFSLSSSDSLLHCCGAVRTQPRFSPATMNRNIESECVLSLKKESNHCNQTKHGNKNKQ